MYNNIKSEEIQNLIHLYKDFQQNKIGIENIKDFFENNRIKFSDISKICDKIQEYDEKYLIRCEKYMNKCVPTIFYNNEIITIKNCKLLALKYYEKEKDLYKIKTIMEIFYNSLYNFISLAHKKHNYKLILNNLKCPECYRLLILKNYISDHIKVKKRLDVNEAFCFGCKSIYKILDPLDLTNTFSLDSTKPYTHKHFVDSL